MSSTSAFSSSTRIVVRPTSGWIPPRLAESWANRHLLYFLAWRDLKVRYAQTMLGAVWTILQPLAFMAVFTLAFRKIGNVEVGETPYPVFVLAGLVFWTFFSRALTQGADSLVANVQLLTRTSCPRLLIPLSPILSGLIDFAVGLSFFFVFAAAYGEFPDWRLAFLPAVLCLGILFLVGPVLLFSALNVRYRDVRQVLPFLVIVWLFVSPVAFPLSGLGEPWITALSFNPLVGIVEALRWSLLGTDAPTAFALAAALGETIVILALGLVYFARAERTLADLA